MAKALRRFSTTARGCAYRRPSGSDGRRTRDPARRLTSRLANDCKDGARFTAIVLARLCTASTSMPAGMVEGKNGGISARPCLERGAQARLHDDDRRDRAAITGATSPLKRWRCCIAIVERVRWRIGWFKPDGGLKDIGQGHHAGVRRNRPAAAERAGPSRSSSDTTFESPLLPAPKSVRSTSHRRARHPGREALERVRPATTQDPAAPRCATPSTTATAGRCHARLQQSSPRATPSSDGRRGWREEPRWSTIRGFSSCPGSRNLGSHILALVRRRLPLDWTERYNTTPVLIETFVETPRFTGAVYRASGWTHVGTTQGRGRYDTHMKRADPKKDILLRPLRRDWKRTLNR